MIFFFHILIAIFSFLIIKSKGEERLAYFYAALFLIPANISLSQYIFYFKEHLIFITCFFISLKRHGELDLSEFKKTGMYVPLTLVFVAYLLVGFMDQRLELIGAIYRATYTFEGTYFAFLVGWFAVNPEHGFDLNVFLKKVLRYSLIATIFGGYTFFVKSNPVLDAIGLDGRFEIGNVDTAIRAFRVTSFFVSSSVYGLVCGYLSFLGTVFLSNKNKVDKIALILLLLNCVWSGTRAAIIPVLILFAVHYLFAFRQNISKILRFIFVVGAMSITTYVLFPSTFKNTAEQYIAMFMSVADDEAQEKMGGSSIDARAIQMASAMEYLKEKPLFGHGMGYSKVVLADGKDEELLGMESYICFLGVEYGGVFTVCIIIFFLSVLYYYYKWRLVNIKLAVTGISMLLCYILFLIYAWVGDSWIYILPLLGLFVKAIYCKQNSLIFFE